MPNSPILRCACGRLSGTVPLQGDETCLHCGTPLLAHHVGGAASAQPTPAAQKAQPTAKAAVAATPKGNSAHPTITKTILSAGKQATIKIDAVTGAVIQDGR